MQFLDTAPIAGVTSQGLADLSATGVADLVLLAMISRTGGAIVIMPDGEQHELRYEDGAEVLSLGRVPAALGDALIARLAIIAQLPLGASDAHLGRLRVRPIGSATAIPTDVVDALLAVRAGATGMVAELHRLAAPTRTEDNLEHGNAPLQLDRHQILGELGQGGMGIVYHGEHIALQKAVAIKVLRPSMAAHAAIAAQFVIEARAACRTRHPGIVDVTDFGRLADGRHYLVMELVPWPTLAARLQHGPLPVRRALTVALRVAEALDAAAAQGVVHRDLKPANIFVVDDDAVKIGDFGLARIVEPGGDGSAPSDGGLIMGTVPYMAPEQARGDAVDGRSDLYSLGCVLYEMLGGCVPYPAVSLVDVIAQHQNAALPPIRRSDGPLPEIVERVVTRCLARRPEERYQRAGELVAELTTARDAIGRADWRRWLPR